MRFKRFLNSSMFPKAEKGTCKWCGGKASRVWCSESCRTEAYVRMGYADRYLYKRDKGVCAKCGMDTIWLKREINKILRAWRTNMRSWGAMGLRREVAADFGPWWSDSWKRLWEADHIIPVCEGGGCCGLENYQTLCLRCHKAETKALKKRLAIKVSVNMMLCMDK